MSEIKLYTPNTGLPDLELKIAYGLCRVAFEAGLDFTMTPRQGWWEVEVKSEKLTEKEIRERFKNSFVGLVVRMLGFEKGFTKVPAGRNIKMRQSKAQWFFGKPELVRDHLVQGDKKIVYEQPHENSRPDWPLGGDKSHYFVCSHADIPEFRGAGIPAIAFVARSWGRDKPFKNSLPGLCKLCGWLSFLGYSSGFPVLAIDKKHKVVLELIPKVLLINRTVPAKIENEGETVHFAEILSLHKTLIASESLLPMDVASVAIPLMLLSAYPTLLGLLWDMNDETKTAEDENARFDFRFWFWFEEGQASQIKDATPDAAEAYRKFLIDQGKMLPNPYNLALLKELAKSKWSAEKSRHILVYPVEHLWPLLVKALTHPSVEERRRLTLDFLRGVAIGLPYLISRKTAKTFLEVVMSIKNKELFDPTKNEGKAVEAVAGVLRCFVEKRDFGFVNRLIGLSNGNLLDFLVQLDRAGQAIATGRTEKGGIMFIPTKMGDKVKHYLPSKDQIDCIVQIASKDDESFKEVKNAIAVSALSNWPRAESKEKPEETTEEPQEEEAENE